MVESENPRNPARLAVELAGHAHVWGRAVAIEDERVRTADSIADRHVDGYLLVLAIRQVLRCAEAMNEAVGGDADLQAAQARFLENHPQAQLMRDVLIHIDEYEAGTGRRQNEVGALAIWLGVGGESVTLGLAPNLMVELSSVSSAALALADATLNAHAEYLGHLAKQRATWGAGTEE